jgi:anaerobic magnesium-protoporphyrin IX monomethyl ester cyclase
MKCIIIFPAWEAADVYITGFAGSQIHYQQPTGVLYVAAAIRKAGHEVKLLDGAFLTNEEIMNEVREFKPRFVGVYGNTPLWYKTINTVNDVKKIDKDIFVVVGGPYPIGAKLKAFEGFDNLDASFTGEGDIAVVEVISCLEKGESLKGVQGIIYKERKSDGTYELIDNGPAPLIEDLDSLAFPARDLIFPLNWYRPTAGSYKRYPVGTVLCSRGCNNRCIYCFQFNKLPGIRYRSPQNVMKEINLLVKDYGAREIRFIDDNFAGDYKWTEEMCKLIKESKLKFTWHASVRADAVDYPLLKKMRNAGCWELLIGIESGVQKNLDMMAKNVTVEQNRKTVLAAKKAGIKVYTPFIFGIPGETFEDGLKTIEFAVEIDPHYVNFHTIAPYPGAELYDNVEKYGTIVGDKSEFNFEMAAFVPYSMTREEIYKLREISFRRFYNRPKYILRRILGVRSRHDLRTLYTGAMSFLYLIFKKNAFIHNKNTQSKTLETYYPEH